MIHTDKKKIEELNISFLRFTNGEIYEALDWVIQTIEAKVKELIESKVIKNPLHESSTRWVVDQPPGAKDAMSHFVKGGVKARSQRRQEK